MKHLLILLALFASLQSWSNGNPGKTQLVSGTVIDASTGESLTGVRVEVKGTSIVAISDENGQFTLEVTESAKVDLVMTFVSFEKLESSIIPSDKPATFFLSEK